MAPKRNIRYIKFRRAQNRLLGISGKPLIRSAEQLNDLPYDIIVYGSDQIWWKSRTGRAGFDPVYWGQFVSSDIKKVSYAASMGIINLTDADVSEIKNYLTAFSHISVRETQLMEVLQPLTDKEICTVLDPTLLVSSSFWESVCHKKAPVNGRYILYYSMMQDDKADTFAKKLSQSTGLPVVKIFGDINSYKADFFNFTTGPVRFVSLVRDAEYVVSTSFHGVALSVQFRKEFYAMGMRDNSGRVLSLLSQLGLEQRMTDSLPEDMSKRIDYDAVHARLSALRSKSADFLISSIQL